MSARRPKIAVDPRIERSRKVILRAVLELPAAPDAGCGAQTIRVTPRGAVVPCVYGSDAELGLEDLRRMGEAIVHSDPFTRLTE